MLERLNKIAWSALAQPGGNDADAIPRALAFLANCDSHDEAVRAYHRVLYAIGNDHAGTYYPAVLETIPFLGEIVERGPDVAREAALDALIDLVGSFCPEPGFETVITSHASTSDLKALVLHCARKLRALVQATAASSSPQSRSGQLARDLLALIDDEV
jgi:hypothetical protein